MVAVPADPLGVAEALRRIDKTLRLRYAEAGSPPYWVVYRVHRNGEPCADDDPERTEELVLTAQDLDHRIVDRVEFIHPDGRGGYDFVAEVEKQNRDAERRRREKVRESVEEYGDQLAHAIRRDLGVTYRGRAPVHRYGRTIIR